MSATSDLLADLLDLTRPVHVLLARGGTACGTDAKTHVTSSYWSDVTCSTCAAALETARVNR